MDLTIATDRASLKTAMPPAVSPKMPMASRTLSLPPRMARAHRSAACYGDGAGASCHCFSTKSVSNVRQSTGYCVLNWLDDGGPAVRNGEGRRKRQRNILRSVGPGRYMANAIAVSLQILQPSSADGGALRAVADRRSANAWPERELHQMSVCSSFRTSLPVRF
jgi:hypothetical protein